MHYDMNVQEGTPVIVKAYILVCAHHDFSVSFFYLTASASNFPVQKRGQHPSASERESVGYP